MYLEIEDFPAYRDLYPAEALEGGILLQQKNIEMLGQKIPLRAEALTLLGELSHHFSGEIVLSVEAPASFDEQPPVISLVADFNGKTSDVESILNAIGENPSSAVEGENYKGFALSSQSFSSDFQLNYAVSEGVLVASNHQDAAKRSIDVIGGAAVESSISDSPIYQKARGHADDFTGALALIQNSESLKTNLKALAASGSDANATKFMEAFGYDAFEGLFVAYPRGEGVLKDAKFGILFSEKLGVFSLYNKPEGDIKVPNWASPDAYSSGVMQLDLGNLKDSILTLLTEIDPNAAEQYQQANGMAAMMIGATIDDLLGQGFGDHLMYSIEMNTEFLAASMTGQNPTNAGSASPIEGTFAIEVADRSILMSVLEKAVAQSGGMVTPEDLNGTFYFSSPMGIPGAAPGTFVNVGLTEDTLFVNIGQEGDLKQVLALAGSNAEGAFQSRTFERVLDGRKSSAVAGMMINYSSLFAALQEGTLKGAYQWTDEETAKLEAYFAFLRSAIGTAGMVVTEEEGAYIFDIALDSES